MKLTSRLDALEATDDHTIVWRLSKPFPALLSKVSRTPGPPRTHC
jgi:ABC-type transport system substrate-binding protein